VFYNEHGGPFRCCRRWFYIGLRAGKCPTLDRRAVQSSRQYIALDLRTTPADGPTTRAVATHDRRPCNCVGRSLFLPRRPRRMAVQGPGPSARRPTPSVVPDRCSDGDRHYANHGRRRRGEDSDRPEVDTEPAITSAYCDVR